ncbi:hypothetical protein cyc_07989 [Cyclospora cayetanensis]|uniref:Uncharacterized protein n=1 Tax=Cyclospora cayetanensis TaxID=88456 RepID=A0A1D3D1K2_9EIME|nr:hypothetical protein cyc_07989 [Cyclospora cayetanensis]
MLNLPLRNTAFWRGPSGPTVGTTGAAAAGSGGGGGTTAASRLLPASSTAVRPRVQQLRHEVISVSDSRTFLCSACSLPMAQRFRAKLRVAAHAFCMRGDPQLPCLHLTCGACVELMLASRQCLVCKESIQESEELGEGVTVYPCRICKFACCFLSEKALQYHQRQHGLEKQLAFLDAAAAAGAASTGAPTDAEGLIAALHAEGEVVLSQEPQHIAPPPAADPQLQHGPPQLQPIQQQMPTPPSEESPAAVSTPDVKEAPVAAPVGPSLSAVASQSSASVAGGDAAVAVGQQHAQRVYGHFETASKRY